MAAQCGFGDRCHAQACSARTLGMSRRRGTHVDRPARTATCLRPPRRVCSAHCEKADFALLVWPVRADRPADALGPTYTQRLRSIGTLGAV